MKRESDQRRCERRLAEIYRELIDVHQMVRAFSTDRFQALCDINAAAGNVAAAGDEIEALRKEEARHG